MPASVLRYRKLIITDLANQAINLAESGTMGHRVQITMSVDDMNRFFLWSRPSGSDRAVGHLNMTPSPGLDFDTTLTTSLTKVYMDVDGVTNGLNYSSSILDANMDSRIRLNGSVSANDIIMSYLLYKCYGKSSAPTASGIYNLEDAQNMLSTATLLSSIHTSLATEEALSGAQGVDKGAIDAMFRDLLAVDPMRFFDAGGKQITGLFETNADHAASGNWGFIENDKIEMRVQFNFKSAVTRRGVMDPTQALTNPSNVEDVESVVIAAGSTFIIRLQIVAIDTIAGSTTKATTAATAIATELAAQVVRTSTRVNNAAEAKRIATQMMNAAAAQTAAANARYQKSVNDAGIQAIAASNAQAAFQAAQAALAEAIATGKSESDVQNQRAATVAAQAALYNADAIALVAQTDIQNSKNAQNAAIVTLANAQNAVAVAASELASANVAAAAASLAVANATKDAAAAAKLIADAAARQSTTDAAAAQVTAATAAAAQAATAAAAVTAAAAADAAAATAAAAAKVISDAAIAASAAAAATLTAGTTLPSPEQSIIDAAIAQAAIAAAASQAIADAAAAAAAQAAAQAAIDAAAAAAAAAAGGA